MKRIILIFTSVSVILTILLAILGIHEIRNAQLNEILTVEKIAGSMLYKYPQEEQTFINAMTSDTTENTAKKCCHITATMQKQRY